MVAAIELYFDPVAERCLRTLWTALDAAGVKTLGDHTHRRHRPHLSLAVADELPPGPVAAVSMVARRKAVAAAVPICSDILPLATTLVSAAVVDHTRAQFTPLPA